MHIGRSRNDQSACDMRLYLRNRAIGLFREVKSFAETLLDLAEEHTGTVMPGFTHYQPAMISPVGGTGSVLMFRGFAGIWNGSVLLSGWSIVTRWERLPDSEVPGPSTVN